MDYSKLSDFEINSAVHNALMKEPYKIEFLGNDRVRWIKGKTDVTTERVAYSKKSLKDYCNNPADAWPIIIDNKLSLNNYGKSWEASFEHDEPVGAFGTDECITNGVEDKNPLRALMIAFLMKVETENAKIPSERDS